MLHAAPELGREAETKRLNSTIPCLPNQPCLHTQTLEAQWTGKPAPTHRSSTGGCRSGTLPFDTATPRLSHLFGMHTLARRIVSKRIGAFRGKPRHGPVPSYGSLGPASMKRWPRSSRGPLIVSAWSIHERGGCRPRVDHAVRFDHAVARPCRDFKKSKL